MDHLKKYLKDSLSDVYGRKIGIHGIAGAGKKFLSDINILEEAVGFDCKIKVSLENRFDLDKLQQDIAIELKKDKDISIYKDPMLRAGMLFTLLDGKKFLLIIDDVGEAFSLEDVGIPEPTESCCSKVLLTTCSWEICQSMTSKNIKLEPLPKIEAKRIFWENFGGKSLTDKHLLNLIDQCIEQCGGFPFAIIKIAESMKDKQEILQWQKLLDELKGNECASDVLKEIIRTLDSGSHPLRDPYIQNCFLRCALYPTDWKISKEDLIEHWIDEGFMDDVESMQSKYDRGHAVINTLENNCLMETVKDGSNMQMPNLVRLMAFDIMNTHESVFMVKPGKKLKKLPELDQWTKKLPEIVSLIGNSISEISSDVSPACKKLSTLLLQRNPLNILTDAFLQGMPNLKVLNLSNSNIKDLPISISNLNNLAALILSRCWQLKQVPSLDKLTKLRKLDLSYSPIKDFPQGLEDLVNLRTLNLYACTLEKLPMNVLPKLSHLQRLILDWSSDSSCVNIEELKVMARLETFVGRFFNLQDLNAYANFLNEGKPDRYILQVGSGSLVLPSRYMHNIRKEVRLWKTAINNLWGKPILKLPYGAQRLMLEECHDLESLCDVHSLIAVAALKECEIVKCKGIKYLQRCSSSISVCGCSALQSVETLSLAHLRDLWSLFGGKPTVIHCETFRWLKSFHIYGCPSIRELFTLSLIKSLSNLEELYVKRCELMKWVIAGEAFTSEGYEEPSNLPKLKQLKLWGLPELTTICSVRMICNGLKEIQVFDCPNLKKIQLMIPASLENIKARKEWWDALEWLDKDKIQSHCDFRCF